MSLPSHIGIIPDGNRRWAQAKGMAKEMGYKTGLEPGIDLFRLCQKIGIKELTYYGFTTDNTKRPPGQRKEFTEACVLAVEILSKEDASLLVLGNADSPMFPKDLLPFTTRRTFGNGRTRVNFLVNYGWEWDLYSLKRADPSYRNVRGHINSSDAMIDLIIRWGGRRRLSGFLPVQSVYADFFVLDEYWPDFQPEHLFRALRWYSEQDVTLGG